MHLVIVGVKLKRATRLSRFDTRYAFVGPIYSLARLLSRLTSKSGSLSYRYSDGSTDNTSSFDGS